MTHISVPHDEWIVNSTKVVKVVLRGEEASTLPPDVFVKALHDNGVLKDTDSRNIRMTIPHNNRKRIVYGDVNYVHRQTFSIDYNRDKISFLLLDPDDARVQVTLLHMPIETSEGAVKYIFNEINPDFRVSDIKVAPGKQMRHDRWQLMVECNDIDEIPHSFVLPNMGPEGENLNIKVFVEGRTTRPSNDPEHLTNTAEQNDTTLTRSTSHDTLLKQSTAATPTKQPPPPIFTPSARPRPTPSPNEGQPLKRVRPGDNNINDSQEYEGEVSDDEREREYQKGRQERDEAYRKKIARWKAEAEEREQTRLRWEEENRRRYGDKFTKRGYRRY